MIEKLELGNLVSEKKVNWQTILHKPFKKKYYEIYRPCTPVFNLAVLHSQQTTDQNKIAKVKEELQKLWNDMQDASVKKDRKALENFYADEFVLIHAGGAIDKKSDWINKIMMAGVSGREIKGTKVE